MIKYFYFTVFLVVACSSPKFNSDKEHAMVVSARVEASNIGLEIMKKGGNAFDAMVGTELALAVAYPFAGNIGGGGFMVYRLNNGAKGSLDYREKAPLAAHKDMYLDNKGNVIPNKSTLGSLAVGVPGTVAGVFAVHERFGSLPIETIITPVIELAKKGIVVTEKQAKRLNSYRDIFVKVNGKEMLFDKSFKVGDTLHYEALSKTLERIMIQGRDGFYKGETADKLVKYLQDRGGIITLKDLEKYEAKWRDPITFTYKDLTITSMSPPSSGGICLAQIMKMIENYPLKEYGHNQTKMIQVVTEAERRAYSDRNYFLGDPDFVNIPENDLLSTAYLKERMSDFSFEKATMSTSVSHGNVSFIESNETTHYCIVDSFGNAISTTTTLNGGYGSKLYVSELGFFLNNEMDDFSAKVGVPNMFQLVGSEANNIAPEKRMLSSMTPTIVERNGKLWMVVGTPGGSTIITSVLQTILNVYEFGMTAQEAVSAKRFHHQWLPDEIVVRPGTFSEDVITELKNKAYNITEKKAVILGKVNAIILTPEGDLEGGAAPRGDDTVLKY